MGTVAVKRSTQSTVAQDWLTRFAWFAVAYNVLVVLWGALVRATGSGAGCGDHWPLCNGEVIPLSPTIHTIIEFTHRCMTGGSTFIVAGLLIWTLRKTAKGRAARTAAILSTILLVNEALLGALLVKLGYVTGNRSVGRMVFLSIHLSNTLLFLAALTLTAFFLQTRHTLHDLRKVQNLGLALAALLLTLLVGVSGSLAALGDTLFPATSLHAALAQDFAANSPLLIRLRSVHPLSALLSAVFVLWLTARTWKAGLPRLAAAVPTLLLLQIGLGFLDVYLLAPVWLQIVHLLVADLYWIALVLMAASLVWPDALGEHASNA